MEQHSDLSVEDIARICFAAITPLAGKLSDSRFLGEAIPPNFPGDVMERVVRQYLHSVFYQADHPSMSSTKFVHTIWVSEMVEVGWRKGDNPLSKENPCLGLYMHLTWEQKAVFELVAKMVNMLMPLLSPEDYPEGAWKHSCQSFVSYHPND